jgi:hypothetical protein
VSVCIRRGGDQPPFSWIQLVLLGWIAGFAQAAFNFISVADFGLMGYAMIYGASGLLLGMRSHSIARQAVFISPIFLVVIIEFLLRSAPFDWFLQFVLPSTALVSLIAGNFAAHPESRRCR